MQDSQFEQKLLEAYSGTIQQDGPTGADRERLEKINRLFSRYPPPEGPGAHLLVVEKGEKPVWHSVSQDTFVIGRGSGSDLVIRDSWVSLRHCEIQSDEEDWRIVDCDATNGLSVNRIKTKSAFLHVGDIIKLGTTKLVFSYSRPNHKSKSKSGSKSASSE